MTGGRHPLGPTAPRPFGTGSPEDARRIAETPAGASKIFHGFANRHLRPAGPKRKVHVVILSRYSDHQLRLSSEDRQLDLLFPFLRPLEPEKVTMICERSVSGQDRMREGLSELEGLIRGGTVTHVLFENVDRLARLESVAHLFWELAEHHGVLFYDLLGCIEKGRFTRDAEAAVVSRKTIRMRSMGGIAMKVEKMLRPARKPFGFIADPNKRSEALRHPQNSKHVQDMYDLSEGGMSDRLIADEMTRRGVYPPAQMQKVVRGKDPGPIKPWQGSSVSNILTDETFTGHLVFGKTVTTHDFDCYKTIIVTPTPEAQWKRCFNPVFAIVPRAKFDAVQALRRGRSGGMQPRRRTKRLLANCVCGCGAKFSFGGKSRSMECRCCRRQVPEAAIEGAVLRYFVLGNAERGSLKRIARDRRDAARRKNWLNADRKADLEAEQDELAGILQNLLLPSTLIETPASLLDATKLRIAKESARISQDLADLPPEADETSPFLATPARLVATVAPLLGRGCIRGDTAAGMVLHLAFDRVFDRVVLTFRPDGRFELEVFLRKGARDLACKRVELGPADIEAFTPTDDGHGQDPALNAVAMREGLSEVAWKGVAPLVLEAKGDAAAGTAVRRTFEGLLFCMRYGVPLARVPRLFGGERECRELQRALDRSRGWPAIQAALEPFDGALDGICFDKAVQRSSRTAPRKGLEGPPGAVESSEMLRKAADFHAGKVRQRILAVADHLDGATLEIAAAPAGMSRQALCRWVGIFRREGLGGILPSPPAAGRELTQAQKRRLTEIVEEDVDPRDMAKRLSDARLLAYCRLDLKLYFPDQAAFKYAMKKAGIPAVGRHRKRR